MYLSFFAKDVRTFAKKMIQILAENGAFPISSPAIRVAVPSIGICPELSHTRLCAGAYKSVGNAQVVDVLAFAKAADVGADTPA